jgi:hypothetical protein
MSSMHVSGKRGWIIIGGLAFILIVFLLGMFTMLGKFASTVEQSQGGLIVLDEDDLEVGNLYGYMDSYVDMISVEMEVDEEVVEDDK